MTISVVDDCKPQPKRSCQNFDAKWSSAENERNRFTHLDSCSWMDSLLVVGQWDKNSVTVGADRLWHYRQYLVSAEISACWIPIRHCPTVTSKSACHTTAPDEWIRAWTRFVLSRLRTLMVFARGQRCFYGKLSSSCHRRPTPLKFSLSVSANSDVTVLMLQ